MTECDYCKKEKTLTYKVVVLHDKGTDRHDHVCMDCISEIEKICSVVAE